MEKSSLINRVASIAKHFEWKTALGNMRNHTGIDSKLEKAIANETERWKEIFRCIIQVTLFLTSRNLAFRGNLVFKNTLYR